MFRRLGIRSLRDLILFLVVLVYALSIFTLMVGAVARDFGFLSFAPGTGRPIIFDLTAVTMFLSAVIFAFAVLWLAFGLLSLGFRSKPLDPATVDIHSPSVSILIPAHNEERVVGQLVRDLLGQDYRQLEVLVIAHNCTDGTIESLRSISDPRVRVFELQTRESGKALALNHGLSRATGEIVAQFDADNRILDPQLVRRAVAYFLTEPHTEVIQCKIETKNESTNLLTRLQAVEYRIFSHLFWGGRNLIKLPCPIGGTGVFFRRGALERVGGWDNELVEDYDMYCKLVVSKTMIAYKPDMVTWDEKPTTWATLLRQRSRWQRGHVGVLAKRWRKWMGLSDMMYLTAPVANAAWYASTVITLLYYTLPWGFSYWYPPAVFWLSLWIAAYATMGLILIKTGHSRDLRYLPAFYVFGFHWLIAFLLATRVKGWEATKTPHGV